MAKPFSGLVARMSPGAQKQVKERTEAMLLELNLQELRQRCPKRGSRGEPGGRQVPR